jgi:hypothetical protein
MTDSARRVFRGDCAGAGNGPSSHIADNRHRTRRDAAELKKSASKTKAKGVKQ